jgi:large subunit ribosomal protein L15
MKPGFEGGQLPIIKRLPTQRGFNNIFKTEFEVVNIGALAIFEAGTEVTPEKLVDAGIINSTRKPVKILGSGEITNSLTVKAHRFSASAKVKIEAAGGKVEEVGDAPEGN